MRELTKTIRVTVMGFSEISEENEILLTLAAEVRNRAQAPYSEYCVGAAIRSEKGTIHVGCNVERCTGTQTTHAEGNATDSMIASLGSSKIRCVAIVGGPAGTEIFLPPKEITRRISVIEDVPMPCGHCLQIIWENCFDDPTVELIALTLGGEVVSTTIGDAFPMRFGPLDVGGHYKK